VKVLARLQVKAEKAANSPRPIDLVPAEELAWFGAYDAATGDPVAQTSELSTLAAFKAEVCTEYGEQWVFGDVEYPPRFVFVELPEESALRMLARALAPESGWAVKGRG